MNRMGSRVSVIVISMLLAVGVACTVGVQRNGAPETPAPTASPTVTPDHGPRLVPCEDPSPLPGFPVIETCWRAEQEMTVDGVTLGPATGPQGPTVNQQEMRLLDEYAMEFGGMALWEAVSPYNDGATIAREVTDGLAGALAALPPTPTPTPDARAEALLAQTREAMAEVRSYRYDIEFANEQYPHSLFPPPVRTGAWMAPDRWVLAVDGVDVMIMIRDEMFVRGTHDGPDAPWYGTFPATGYPGFIPHHPYLDLTRPTLMGEENIDGQTVHRISGEHRLEFARPDVSYQVEVLIRQSDHLPVRLKVLDAYRGVEAGPPGTTPVPRPLGPRAAMTYDYHGFNEPVVIEPPERWEEGPLPTATPGQSFRATLGFRPEPQELTDAQWAELAAAVRDLLHDAGHTQASVRLLDNMLWVDAPYTREQAAELARLVREGPLPFPLELRAEGFGYTGSP